MTVTVVIPARVDAVPEVPGDPDQIETFGSDLLKASVSFDDLDSVASNPATLTGWEGIAADAYHQHIRATATDTGTISLTLRAAARAAQDYGDELRRLQTQRALLVDDRESFHARVLDFKAHVEGSTEDDLIELSARSNVLQGRRASLVDDIEVLVRDMEANDQSLNALLSAHDTMESARVTTSAGDPADAAMRKPGSPTQPGVTPQQTADWWAGLSESEQDALIAANPEVIGAADGIPADVRDGANRIQLDNDIAALELAESNGTLDPNQIQQLATARSVRNALDGVGPDGQPFPQYDRAGELVTPPSTPPRDPITGEPVEAFLLVYKPEAHHNDGGVAISMGNPDTADNVAVAVPGVDNEGKDTAGGTRNAYNLYTSARFADPNSSTASVYWLDYDSPSGDALYPESPQQDEADAGAKTFDTFVDGIKQQNPSSHVTAIGHSYGSVLVAQAGADYQLAVDDFVLLGSPGPGRDIDHATDLGVGREHVFVGDASDDGISQMSDGSLIHGGDVTVGGFDAVRIQAESAHRGDGEGSGHSRYYDPETESLNNLSQIVVGDLDEVTTAEYEEYIIADDSAVTHHDPESDRTPTTVERKPEW